ncbi:hypothetical protein [Nostoc sp. LPT]|uniref:hypothetical protein n=1 Tax=Nostoc sp. LPT TaxID=2815387 RepID=UPI001D4B2F86|nr:hypothetical protein [Nostoc sp. LPT]MBN4001130.1 hypothetical protein [Nostoc sp. LPT]
MKIFVMIVLGHKSFVICNYKGQMTYDSQLQKYFTNDLGLLYERSLILKRYQLLYSSLNIFHFQLMFFSIYE